MTRAREQVAVGVEGDREIGLALRLPQSAAQLAWNRASLWNAAPPGWLDGPREKAAPEKLAATVSRRNLYWLAFEAGGRPLLLASSDGTMNLRFASSPRNIVLSSFLDSPGFLGKYDLPTLEKKITAGQTLAGGVTIYLLPRRAWADLP